MKKQMNILDDGKQNRVSIPKEFVDEFKITTKDKVEWDNNNGKLKGELKKHG